MAARSYQLVLAAGAQRVSDVYGDGAGVVNAAHDIPYRQILLDSSTSDAYIGADSSVTSTVFGMQVGTGVNGNHPVSIGPFETGPVKLSDLYAAGAGATLHILAIPF